MNLKAIDAALAAYGQAADEDEAARLSFFRKLWEVEKTGEALSSPYVPASPERLEQLYDAGRPVFLEAPVAVEPAALGAMMRRMCACARAENTFSPAAAAALGLLERSQAAACSVCRPGEDPAAYLEALGAILADEGMDQAQLAVALPLAALALRSQIAQAASAVAEVLRGADVCGLRALRCPACGGQAAVARVGGAAGRYQGRTKTLWCSQCGCAWEFERVRCARCGTQNQGHLHYFNIEGDEAHRLATCDECGGYVRTVYAEDALGPFSFEVEDVVMARLDAVARRLTFAGAAPGEPVRR